MNPELCPSSLGVKSGEDHAPALTFPPKLRAAGTPCNGATAARSFSEVDAAPQPGPWWILALLTAVILIAGPLWIISRMIDAVLSIQWPI
jgi:hypothetical protein